MRLRRKVALVAGSGRGIGASIAEAFAAESSQVWVSDIDGRGTEDVADRIGAAARPLALDVRRPDDWRAAGQAIFAHDGRLDVLVDNAGIAAAAFMPDRTSAVVGLGAHPFGDDLSWLREHMVGGLDGWIAAIDATSGPLPAPP